ncbi:hypothetical protein [Tsukamurella sp. PLM1]|uniref:hypothetical protein n=1 Tax=Tsukamurella sp. PLM1 TaxID=2929795 RepID=UPI00204569B9|nr:hypothetical protein [Tsukamurella sp. PLM1]BDH57509.1 hypothetical protein MTP03_24480 [Tsukamurella sp. PLM1]
MVFGLLCSAAMFLTAAILGAVGAIHGTRSDWFINVVGGLFFGVGGVVVAWLVSSLPVPRHGALRLVGGTDVRGRLGPRFVAVAIVALLHSVLVTVTVANVIDVLVEPGDRTSLPTALTLAGFTLMIDVFFVGHAVGMYRASRMVLLSIGDEGVSTATATDSPAYARWDDVSGWMVTPEAVFVPTIGRDIRHHLVWRFDGESVRTPVDLRPSPDEITREIARRAPHVRKR